MKKEILVLHGPNLNLLGLRETAHYGETTLEALDQELKTLADKFGISLRAHQSNSEASLIDAVHRAHEHHTDYLILNPAAYTHTSIALRDALLAVQIPFIEVHLSNIFSREPFRKHSYFSDIATGVISGLGTRGYLLALESIHHQLNK